MDSQHHKEAAGSSKTSAGPSYTPARRAQSKVALQPSPASTLRSESSSSKSILTLDTESLDFHWPYQEGDIIDLKSLQTIIKPLVSAWKKEVKKLMKVIGDDHAPALAYRVYRKIRASREQVKKLWEQAALCTKWSTATWVTYSNLMTYDFDDIISNTKPYGKVKAYEKIGKIRRAMIITRSQFKAALDLTMENLQDINLCSSVPTLDLDPELHLDDVPDISFSPSTSVSSASSASSASSSFRSSMPSTPQNYEEISEYFLPLVVTDKNSLPDSQYESLGSSAIVNERAIDIDTIANANPSTSSAEHPIEVSKIVTTQGSKSATAPLSSEMSNQGTFYQEYAIDFETKYLPCPLDHPAQEHFTPTLQLQLAKFLDRTFKGMFSFNLHRNRKDDTAVVYILIDEADAKMYSKSELLVAAGLDLEVGHHLDFLMVKGEIGIGSSALSGSIQAEAQEQPRPGASIGTNELPTISGSLGWYVRDKRSQDKFVLTVAQNIAKWGPSKGNEEPPAGQDRNELLPAGTIILHPSLSDYEQLLAMADTKRKVYKKNYDKEFAKEYPPAKPKMLACRKELMDLFEQEYQNLLDFDLEFAELTNVKELSVSNDERYAHHGFYRLFDYALLKLKDPDRRGQNVIDVYSGDYDDVNRFKEGMIMEKNGRSAGYISTVTLPIEEKVGHAIRFPGLFLAHPACQYIIKGRDGFWKTCIVEGDSGGPCGYPNERQAMGLVQGYGYTTLNDENLNKISGAVTKGFIQELVMVFERIEEVFGIELELETDELETHR